MIIPPKAAAAVLSALALAFFVGPAAQATDPALRTAKDGWSTEPNCQRMTHMKHTDDEVCYVATEGLWVEGRDRPYALLQYLCDTFGQEHLAIALMTDEPVGKDNLQIPVQWDRSHRVQSIGTWFQVLQVEGTRAYYYFLNEPAPFIDSLREHQTLTVTIPYRYDQGKTRFKLANAIPSIKKAMMGCHIRHSALGDIHR